jgi:hypothetical protein
VRNVIIGDALVGRIFAGGYGVQIGTEMPASRRAGDRHETAVDSTADPQVLCLFDPSQFLPKLLVQFSLL